MTFSAAQGALALIIIYCLMGVVFALAGLFRDYLIGLGLSVIIVFALVIILTIVRHIPI